MAFAAVLAAAASNASAFAAGVDSRLYSCADVHALVAAHGFLFISQPAFGDFVVADGSFCGRNSVARLRSVPTRDNPECLVNYCTWGRGGP